MKRKVTLSLAALAMVAGSSAFGAEDLSSMFSEGKTSGQIRLFSIDRLNQGSAGNKTHRNATAAGGNLKFETAAYEGLSFGTALYTTNMLFSSPTVDPTLTGPNNDGYSILGEAYAQYVRGNTILKFGRQKLDTPLAGSDDARMLPNLFEAYVLINKDIPDTTVIAAHVTKFAQGTFGRAYGAGGLLGATSGYSAWDASNQTGDFVNMGTYAINQKTDGVSVLSATYAPNKNIKVQVWDYYAHNILNAIYGEVNANWNCIVTDAIKPSAGVQVIKESSIGDKLAGDVDSLYWAAKVGAKVSDLSVMAAYSQQSASDGTNALQKSTITPWGGMPAYTQGMVTRHMFISGTKATKVAATYDFKNMGTDVKATAYYAMFKMDANSGYGIERTAAEPGFDIIYNPEMVKKLQLRLRGNFPTKFAETVAGDTGWSEYRFIANYNF